MGYGSNAYADSGHAALRKVFCRKPNLPPKLVSFIKMT